MVDSTLKERLIRLADVPKLDWLPTRNGKPISLATVHRWAAYGLRGKKMRTVSVGGSLCTRESWLEEFFAELVMPVAEIEAGHRTINQRERSLSRAEKSLAAEGLI